MGFDHLLRPGNGEASHLQVGQANREGSPGQCRSGTVHQIQHLFLKRQSNQILNSKLLFGLGYIIQRIYHFLNLFLLDQILKMHRIPGTNLKMKSIKLRINSRSFCKLIIQATIGTWDYVTNRLGEIRLQELDRVTCGNTQCSLNSYRQMAIPQSAI